MWPPTGRAGRFGSGGRRVLRDEDWSLAVAGAGFQRPGMSGDREKILSRVQAALAPLPQRAAYPQWSDPLPVMPAVAQATELWAYFGQKIKGVNGLMVEDAAAVAAHLRAKGALRGYCDPELWPKLQAAFGAGFTVETTYDDKRIDDFRFGITRAAGAIAETGSLILTDRGTSDRLAALAPWIHVAVVPRAKIFRTIGDALLALGDDPNVIWATGPSKTADVEGILIEGVHGPGEQLALVIE